MTSRLLRFVNAADEAGDPDPKCTTVVLSPWWTPVPDAPAGLVPVRDLARGVLERVDLLATSIVLLDDWADAAGIPDLLVRDGVGWWDRVRMALRWDVYELVLWRHVVGALEPTGCFDHVVVPTDRPNLAAVCKALGLPVVLGDHPAGGPDRMSDAARPMGVSTAATPAPTAGPRARVSTPLWVRIRRRLLRTLRLRPDADAIQRRRLGHLEARFARLAARSGILAVSWAGAYQVLNAGAAGAKAALGTGADADPRLGDPFLDPAIDRLAGRGESVAVAVMGIGHRSAKGWAALERDPNAIPVSWILARWGREEDSGSASMPLTELLDGQPIPGLDVAGCDMTATMLELLAPYLGPWLDERQRLHRAASRFLGDLRPRAVLIDREGTRTPWIAAAHDHGIPVVTTQHGMIYPGNPEYSRHRSAEFVRPDRTCVFGNWERDLLVDEAGYDPDEVIITGSPRVPTFEPAPPDDTARATVRRELGVAPGDRMIVISAAHNPIGELMTASMLASALDGPLPGIHLVVKLHPQDSAPADYAAFFAGLAAAGGYAPPRVSVIRDVDLARLLNAADAHLGQSSTMLTDAVAAGLPNMLVTGSAHADPIGYVRAGVAVPVRSAAEVRAFVTDPRAPDPAARKAFLEAHFLSGDASMRLADVVSGAADAFGAWASASASGEPAHQGAGS